MKFRTSRTITWAVAIAATMSVVACGPPKHVEVAPARGDSYSCARAKLTELSFEIFEEDSVAHTLEALKSMTLVGADGSEQVVFDQLRIRVKPDGERVGELEVTVSAGMLQRGLVGVAQVGNARDASTFSMITPKDEPPTERGIAAAQAVLEACSRPG